MADGRVGGFSAPPPPGIPSVNEEPDDYADRARSVLANVMLGLDLFLLGLGMLLGVIFGIGLLTAGDAERRERLEEIQPSSESALWLAAAGNLLALGLVPLAWVFLTRVRPWEGAKRYLGFTKPWGHATFVGVGLGGCFLGGVILLTWLFWVFGADPGAGSDEPDAYGFGLYLTWPLAVFIALSAGFGEEILFRGVLYRWLGWWGQAPLFMLGHFGAGEPIQLALTLVVGLVFGWLRKIGWSLWTLIVAHSVYDFCVLSTVLILGS